MQMQVLTMGYALGLAVKRMIYTGFRACISFSIRDYVFVRLISFREYVVTT